MRLFVILTALALPMLIQVAPMSPLGSLPAWAQSPPLERLGKAESPIFDDNLDEARGRAVRSAKYDMIRGTVAAMVADEWLVLFDAEVRKNILRRIDRYISAYRVRRLDTSLDRTRYFAEVAGQIDRPRLEQDLRELGLPLLSDPPLILRVYYARNDPVLSQRSARESLTEALRARLTKLNFSISGITALSAAAAQRLATPSEDASGRKALLADHRAVAGLFLQFQLPQQDLDEPNQSQAPAEMRALFYQADNGALLGAFSHQSAKAPGWEPDGGVAIVDLQRRLVQPLFNQFQPGALRPFVEDVSETNRLKIRVLGLDNFQDVEDFEQSFFRRNSKFRGFSLYGIDRRSNVYEGVYAGSRRVLEKRLRGSDVGAYRIREVFWIDDILELEIVRRVAPKPIDLNAFPEEERQPLQRRVIEAFLTEKDKAPEKFPIADDPLFAEQEDNGWFDKANLLEFNATIYGFVDSRGDMDFYVGEFLDEGEKLEIVLQRLDRSNLAPAMRIYDAQRNRRADLHGRKRLTLRYKMPKGETRFYLEIGDRFRFVNGDSGGYLSYHYLLTVRRPAALEKLAGTNRD